MTSRSPAFEEIRNTRSGRLRRLSSIRVVVVSTALPVGVATAEEDEEYQPTAAEQAAQDAWERISIASRASADLRLRLLLSTDGLEQRDGRMFTKATIPVATLVEQARGSTDPLTLDLLLKRCLDPAAGKACDSLDVARRWTQADTQNQAAWIALARGQRDASDIDGAHLTFQRGARASTWHDHEEAAARLIAARGSRRRWSFRNCRRSMANARSLRSTTRARASWRRCSATRGT